MTGDFILSQVEAILPLPTVATIRMNQETYDVLMREGVIEKIEPGVGETLLSFPIKILPWLNSGTIVMVDQEEGIIKVFKIEDFESSSNG